MSLAKRVTVGTSPTLLHKADNDGCHVDIRLSKGATTDVMVGNEDVTTASGFEFDASESPSPILQINLAANETVYGIVGTGTEVVDVFVTQDKRF